jgi:hypothetical protein
MTWTGTSSMATCVAVPSTLSPRGYGPAFAYVAQLAFGIGLLEIAPVLRLVREPDRREPAEAFYRHSLHEILDRRSHLAEFLLALGREARALAAECA